MKESSAHSPPRLDTLSMRDFRKLGAFINSELGIKMPDAKRGMVESRLRRRLTRLKMESYSDYCTYLFSSEGMENELVEFINVITTNKTDFFRESHQFTYLTQEALPELVGSGTIRGTKTLSIWSTACSRGHEPYTLAMVLAEFARTLENPRLSFKILGTDISTRVLDIAQKAVYDHEEIEPVPMALRKRYLLRSKDREKKLVRIVPGLRSRVRLCRLNLMDNAYPMVDQMDIIFCRNVMIYFERETQETLLLHLCRHLKPGGYLFVGHSEVLQCSKLPLVSRGASIYRKLRD
ncbi:CheR family methyltransferase [Desulfospira joergensenii]|uniref:CheR family methyltransferase n=1 Tax=Desulfospira joergensenii TaxID=53329 RepID=UPI0003B5E9AF|nr:CheR family methyltransferase [Desulfospira joergensenii]